jgi:O-succinylbenzoic acid--CoA ligase
VLAEAQHILSAWRLGQETFTLSTSGSTGEPTPIHHHREALIWSANSTLKLFFDVHHPPTQLCVLPLNKAGGFMQIIRSAVWNTPIWILPAKANPLINLENCILLNPEGTPQPFTPSLWKLHPPTTVSLTPMQLALALDYETSCDLLSTFNCVLLGGQTLSAQIEQKLIIEFPNTRFIHTFGSTETASHFAGREITPGNSDYCIAPGTQITTNTVGELQVCNPTTQHQWITLHDRVEITSPNHFRWLERTNLYINSGGLKIGIEALENRIADLLNWEPYTFYCVGKKHPVLGEQITLVTQHHLPQQKLTEALSALPKLEQPKEIVFINTIPTLPNGKIYRNPNP